MKKRLGRPRAKLPKAKALVTRRIRRLIDLAHDGNLNEASRVTGIAYPTLRSLYLGHTTNPSLSTLEKLRAPYGFYVEWFTREDVNDEVPIGGIVGLIPPHPRIPPGKWVEPREVVIPYAAWPMYEVFTTLGEWLDQQPPSPDRMFVGDATDRLFTERLTTFLLEPMLTLEKRMDWDFNVILPAMPVVPQDIPTGEDAERWVQVMKALGLFWKAAIPRILETAARDLGAKPIQAGSTRGLGESQTVIDGKI